MDEKIKNNTGQENKDFYAGKIQGAKDIGSVKNLIKEQIESQKNKGIENKDAINTVSVIEKVENSLDEIQKVFDEKDEVKKQEYLLDLNKKRKDPLEGIETIGDKKIRNKLVGLLLGNDVVKNYFSTVFNFKSIPLIMESWKEIQEGTPSPEVKKNTEEFVKTYTENVKNANEGTSFIDELIEKSKKAKESLNNCVNLSDLFDKNPDFKENLKQEIKSNIIDKVNLEYIENEEDTDTEGPVEEEEDYLEKKYDLITNFYENYLEKDNNMYMEKEEANDLWIECNEFLQKDNKMNECPALLKLTDFLRDKSQKHQEGIEAESENEILPDFDLSDALEKPDTGSVKPEKKDNVTGFWSSIKSMAILGGVNFAFVTLSQFIFSPVSMAIWLSKQRVNKNGIDLKDWKEPFQIGSIAKDEKKDKK